MAKERPRTIASWTALFTGAATMLAGAATLYVLFPALLAIVWEYLGWFPQLSVKNLGRRPVAFLPRHGRYWMTYGLVSVDFLLGGLTLRLLKRCGRPIAVISEIVKKPD